MTTYLGNIPTPPRVLSETEQETLLQVTGEHRRGFRDHMIISLALGTALREHELAALDVGDVFHRDGKVRIRVALRVFKRSNSVEAIQEVVLSQRLRTKLVRFFSWKERNGEDTAAGSPLFISRKRNRLSTRQMRTMFRSWQRRAGFEHPYTFHCLRHTSCTNLLRRNPNLREVQRFARHKDIRSTERYTHPTVEDLIRAVQELPC